MIIIARPMAIVVNAILMMVDEKDCVVSLRILFDMRYEIFNL